VIGTDANGCENTDQVVVTVNPLPLIDAGADLSLCEGETITFSATGAVTYTWDSGVLNNVPFYPVVGTSLYTVIGTSNSGCIGTDQVSVTVISTPQASFTPDVTTGCAPLTVTFTNNTTAGTDCQWSFSNGASSQDCGSTTVTFDQAGCYDATLTVTEGGCSSTITAASIVCVDEMPVADFTMSAGSVSEFDPTVVFTNESQGAQFYNWDFGDGSNGSDATNPIYTYPSETPGIYTVTLVASSSLGCSDTAIAVVEVYEELLFYVPNTFTPDGDNFNQTFEPVFTSGFDPYDYSLFIYNRWGELIFESHDSEIGWDGSYGAGSNNFICQDGTYTWVIRFKRKENDEYKEIIGHVNVLK
jgi:gliding motility-associated-like protein